ncbi:MAG TPA: hypothetical protein VJ966_07790, partial [Actinomycetes bacterium]|nr:hypothetical protein [Actinomycetes bacterium]
GAGDLLAAALGVPAETRHWAGIWRHIKARLAFIGEHFWQVIRDAALEILIPGVALYRHIPEMLVAIQAAWSSAWAGDYSDAIDHVLELLRALMAIVTSFIAQVSIAAFILGSVFGTPVVGVAALTAIGVATIAIDAAIQAATIRKSVYNLGRPDRSQEQDEADYGRIADSSLALAIMAALVLLGALASKAASALVRRFPAVAAVAESLKARLRGAVGLGPRKPPAPRPSVLAEMEAGIEPRPPMATEHQVRASLTPNEQLALDKWVAERRAQLSANGASPKDVDAHIERALRGKTPEQVRSMLKKQLSWVGEQQQRQARAAEMRAGDPLDPTTRNRPTRAGGDDVWIRWDDSPPTPKEIGEAAELAAKTGERVDLFGDNYQGIDGTIGRPPRPLQLKGLQASDPPAEAVRVAQDALENARGHYSNLEVNIQAPGATVEQVKAAFNAVKGSSYLDGRIISRIRVWCGDGLFEPTAFTPVPPPPHLDLQPAERK